MTKAVVGSLRSPGSPSGNCTLQGRKRVAYKAQSPVQKTEIISAKASGMSGLAISKLFDIGKSQVYSVGTKTMISVEDRGPVDRGNLPPNKTRRSF